MGPLCGYLINSIIIHLLIFIVYPVMCSCYIFIYLSIYLFIHWFILIRLVVHYSWHYHCSFTRQYSNKFLPAATNFFPRSPPRLVAKPLISRTPIFLGVLVPVYFQTHDMGLFSDENQVTISEEWHLHLAELLHLWVFTPTPWSNISWQQGSLKYTLGLETHFTKEFSFVI